MEEPAKFHNRNPSSEISETEVLAILKQADIGILSMAYESWPYCVPVNFVYANEEIYIHSAKTSKKLTFIDKNPLVCFSVIGEYSYIKGECNYAFESVLVYGKAWLLEDVDQKRKAYEALIAKYEPEGEYTLKDGCVEDSEIIVIEIDDITGKRKNM